MKKDLKYNLIDLRSKTAKDVKEDFKRFYDEWIFTWEGMMTTEENLKAIVKELKLDNPTFYVYSGKQMNSVYRLKGSNAYPNDLDFLSIEDFQNPAAKIRYGARWFTDIVDNNRRHNY